MKSTGIIRSIDDLGRVVVPKAIRDNLKIREGDAFEIFTDRDGTVIFKPYSKSFEKCAIDWYNKAINIHDNSDFNFSYFRHTEFYRHGDYTFCVVGRDIPNFVPLGGHSKRFEKDVFDERIGRVAAYARAMGRNLDKMIGYKG